MTKDQIKDNFEKNISELEKLNEEWSGKDCGVRMLMMENTIKRLSRLIREYNNQ